jgi:hypothetical protein
MGLLSRGSRQLQLRSLISNCAPNAKAFVQSGTDLGSIPIAKKLRHHPESVKRCFIETYEKLVEQSLWQTLQISAK